MRATADGHTTPMDTPAGILERCRSFTSLQDSAEGVRGERNNDENDRCSEAKDMPFVESTFFATSRSGSVGVRANVLLILRARI
ncbi:hypothetical protein EVAR_90622_1 [Eumeta japonica]|uniref:Uncharacterized protein n=1 Tax=Eumeta variegata TaxID=151549 RepID=A0A4C1ZVY7_EUMVA|nr:hypothetical protein EVAR_90622_1 [Eumeta japonica]